MSRTYIFQDGRPGLADPWTEEFSPERMNKGTIPIILRMAGEEAAAEIFESQKVYFRKYPGNISDRINDATDRGYRVRQIMSLNNGITKMFKIVVPMIHDGGTDNIAVISYGTSKGAWDAFCIKGGYKKEFLYELFGVLEGEEENVN